MGWIQPDQLPILPVKARFFRTGEYGHDLLIGSFLQKTGLVKCLDQPECQERGQEITELAPDHRVTLISRIRAPKASKRRVTTAPFPATPAAAR